MAKKRTGDSPRSWVVAQLGRQPAVRVPVAALRGLDSVDGILPIRRLRAEGEMEQVGRRASGGQPLVVPV
jgi:hypothetical protein